MTYLINYGKGGDGDERLQALSKLKVMERSDELNIWYKQVYVCTYKFMYLYSVVYNKVM